MNAADILLVTLVVAAAVVASLAFGEVLVRRSGRWWEQ